MDHQSNEATDIRFVALYFNQLSGEVHLLREQVDLLVAYPSSKHTDEIMCIEYGCIPYIRYPVSLHYISLLSESMLDIEHIVKLRFKMSVAFVVYQLCDKGRLARVSLEEFLKQIQAYNFNEKLFRVLAEHDINENSFLGHTITQLVIDELEAFYNILAEESGI